MTFIALAAAATAAFSQGRLTLSPVLEESKEVWFDETTGIESSGIINGPEYFMPFTSTTSFPFFLSRNSSLGEVVYGNQVYRGIPLSFDCFSGVLVLTLKRKNDQLLQLDSSRVSEFIVHGHLFRKLAQGAPGKPAFYEILYESSAVQLVAHRTKVRVYNSTAGKVEYGSDDRIYFKGRGAWIMVNGARSLAALVNDKKELQNFMKSKGISPKRATDNDLVRIAGYLSENPSLLRGS